jgi:uncharacterized protein (UPF0332 family)
MTFYVALHEVGAFLQPRGYTSTDHQGIMAVLGDHWREIHAPYASLFGKSRDARYKGYSSRGDLADAGRLLQRVRDEIATAA